MLLHCKLKSIIECITTVVSCGSRQEYNFLHHVVATCNTSDDTHNNAFRLAIQQNVERAVLLGLQVEFEPKISGIRSPLLYRSLREEDLDQVQGKCNAMLSHAVLAGIENYG